MLSRQVADSLRKYETPFYFYDIDLLRQTLESITSVARRYGFVIHYAIKANYDPHILSVIREYGLGVDCASGNEVRCAIEAGFDPSGIMYAGVGKRDKELRYAVEQADVVLPPGVVDLLEGVLLYVGEGHAADVGEGELLQAAHLGLVDGEDAL